MPKILYSFQSGTAYSPWSKAEDTENYLSRARKISELAGCNSKDIPEIVACLVDTSTDDLINATSKVRLNDFQNGDSAL